MTSLVEVQIDDTGVARILIDNPPVNALSQPLRAALMDAVHKAESDPLAKVIVLSARGRTFPAGADIKEYHAGPDKPVLSQLCHQIETCRKPVIAALHGTTLGGGFELALAAHYRIALSNTKIGLPEVTLGLLPGSGGTQRLPRLCGAVAALDLMLAGKPVSASEAHRLGLIDQLVQSDIEDAAQAFAMGLIDSGTGPRPTRDRTDGLHDMQADLAAIADRRKRTAALKVLAARHIVDCVEAALLLPFESGLALEEAAFEDCLASPESHGLRHAFLCERIVGRIPEAAQAAPRPQQMLAITGRGPGLCNTIVMALDGPRDIALTSPAAETVRAQVEQVFAEAIAKQRLNPTVRDAKLSRLVIGPDAAVLDAADLIVAQLPEGGSARVEMLTHLVNAGSRAAVLCLIDATQDDLGIIPDPERVVGVHLPTTPHLMRVAEVLIGPNTGAEAVMTVVTELQRMGRVAVCSRSAPIGLRLNAAGVAASDAMILQGASPYQIDAVMRAEGFAIGPYQRLDRDDQAMHSAALGPMLSEKGWSGQSAGRGFYAHEQQGAQAAEHPSLHAMLKDLHGRAGTGRRFSPAEIRQRIYAAMANAGAWMVERGEVLRPAEIDVAMLLGQGFPRWRGGPMMVADENGLLAVKKSLEILAEEDAAFWTPAPLFAQLIKNGRRFSDLNAG